MAYIKKRTTATGEVRYHVEYRTPDGKIRSKTFRRKRDADDYRRTVETELSHGGWVDPQAGKVPFGEYSARWLASRGRLSPRTRDLYEGQLRLHICPVLGGLPLNSIDARVVREWHAGLYGAGRIGPNTIAKCYRLVHTIFEAAVGDDLVRRNPCTIRDAGREEYDERPIATIPEVFELASLVRPERRALVLLAGFGGLRLGELLALRRRHVDVLHRRVIVRETTVELARGELVTKGPKSAAGRRSVHLDPVVFEKVTDHLAVYVAADPDAYLFTGDKGGQLRRAVWHREWGEARQTAGLAHLHFHDLRHTHGTMVARAGATTRETMRRLGQSTVDAAMIYQHATDGRDQALAEAIGRAIRDELGAAGEGGARSGSKRPAG
jgi:integrase